MQRVIVVMALAAAACGGGDPTPAHTGSADPPRPATIDIAKLGSGTPVRLPEPPVELPKQLAFELVDAGSGARAPLRYALAPATIDYTIETRLASRRLEAGTWTPIVKQPPVRDGFAITPAAKPGALAVRALDGEIVGTKTPEAEAYAKTWAVLLAKRRLAVALDDRGQLGAIEFADDPNHTQGTAAHDEAAQRLLGTVVPLPQEPVGVGATWRVSTALRQRMAIVKQNATYKLIARSATAWTIHVVLHRDAQEQTIDDPSLPPGATENLVAIVRTLEGDLAVTPTRPLGTGTLTIDARVHLRVTLPHAPQVENILEDTGSLVLAAAPE